MKVAAAQISCVLGDRAANLRKVRDFASRAKRSGSELIVFPEMTDTGYSMPTIKEHAAFWKEGAVPELQKIAKELVIGIVCGISDRDGESIYNAQVFVDANGKIIAKYRKTHLVTATPLDERSCFSPGNEFIGRRWGEFNIGLTICYDLRFPEVCRTLAVEHNVNAFVTSSAWPSVRMEHLQVLVRSRAIENQCYLILANRVGTDDGVTFCGSSAIIDPSGAILAAASVDREELLEAEISKDGINAVRTQMAVFAHRRSDLY
jgi:predicted amidohydrolase